MMTMIEAPSVADLDHDDVAQLAGQAFQKQANKLVELGADRDAVEAAALGTALSWALKHNDADLMAVWLRRLADQLAHGGDDDCHGHA